MSARGALLVLLSVGGAALPACPATIASAPAATTAVTRVPLVKGLVVIGAASERQGDYESTLSVDSIEPDGTLHLITEAEIPDASGGKPQSVRVSRDVKAADLETGRTYKYMFFTGAEDEYPGTTSMGTSAAVVSDLRSRGEASIKLDGEAGESQA